MAIHKIRRWLGLIAGWVFLLFSPVFYSCQSNEPDTWIRVNQLGFYSDAPKYAVLVSKSDISPELFRVLDEEGNEVFRSEELSGYGAYGPFKTSYRLEFTGLNETGSYVIEANGVTSPSFEISDNAYAGVSDFLLRYMRQQRCGFNPFLRDSCHVHDGFVVYGDELDSTYIDVKGGWHDATDYLQYVATSAHATYNMLFAYERNPEVFGDSYNAAGLEGSNGVPDVADEIRWGLDWLLKMHPAPDLMFNQIADDRDHIGFRLPVDDPADYGMGNMRPVYKCTGEVQGFKYKNRATGIASTAGKFTSAFSHGYLAFKDSDPAYAARLKEKARTSWELGLAYPGACQTAPGGAPYFYEEDNWVDDMEMAAGSLYKVEGNEDLLEQGYAFGVQEEVTPWMINDTARHYQWYPFLNYGHYMVASQVDGPKREELLGFYRKGIEILDRKADNAFRRSVPFIWCSNNLTASFAIQCALYREMTGDESFLELETAAFDWLFGCNPWGTSMVCALPEGGEFPVDTHSSYVVKLGDPLDGGLVDGPVSSWIYDGLIGADLTEPDEFEAFQSQVAVYHDDIGDYSTNEPTMDGTAILVTLMSFWER